jgi:DNA gyrase inhibitor GyrI
LATTLVHLHNSDVPVKVVNLSTAPTAQRMKGLQNEEIWSGQYAVEVYKQRLIKPSPRSIA